MGKVEDARVGFDALARAVEDAIYLDEDAFNQTAPIHQYTTKIQVQVYLVARMQALEWLLTTAYRTQAQQHRIVELETLLADTESRLAQAQHAQRGSQQGTDDLRHELENNAGDAERMPSSGALHAHTD